MAYAVAAFYHFAPVPDPASVQGPLRRICGRAGVKGTLLVAPEGVNGTIAGARAGIDAVLAHVRALPGFATLEHRESTARVPPFLRMKVRLKREIVTMGRPDVDPTAAARCYVEAGDWNALVDDPGVVLIDTRNFYETEIGTFDGAIDPGIETFGQFPAWWAENAVRFAGKKVAMFCTGGIRCEKSAGYLIMHGAQVCHLKGGILKYLEHVPQADSRWRGSCFVFDRRVSVGHGLAAGPHMLCHGCRRPILPADARRPEYEHGVSCHHCAGTVGAARKARFRERQRQICISQGCGGRVPPDPCGHNDYLHQPAQGTS
ncbi:MAG: rhodanese-related sulfurtransferase [Rhodobacteraceae bacterium]|nr:rhodanese-related sulfurtransferase [Paracoccaceae bacterium]